MKFCRQRQEKAIFVGVLIFFKICLEASSLNFSFFSFEKNIVDTFSNSFGELFHFSILLQGTFIFSGFGTILWTRNLVTTVSSICLIMQLRYEVEDFHDLIEINTSNPPLLVKENKMIFTTLLQGFQQTEALDL